MNREAALNFIEEYNYKYFYQPIVFVPGRLEIQGRWHEQTKKLADILFESIENKTVLDVGCNIGYFLHEAMRRKAKECLGVDHDIVEIGIANRLCSIFKDGVQIVHSDANSFVPNKAFDIVLLLNISYALPDPKQTILKYLEYCSEFLFVEHDSKKQDSLPLPSRIIPSPRCAGQRNISIYTGLA